MRCQYLSLAGLAWNITDTKFAIRSIFEKATASISRSDDTVIGHKPTFGEALVQGTEKGPMTPGLAYSSRKSQRALT